MAYTPLQLGSPTSSKEAISRSLIKVDTMLNELYNTNPSTIDWTNFSNTILPSADSTYDLGSANKKWRSLYVSSNTIYIGTSALSITEQGNIQVNGNTFSPVVSYNDLSNKPTLFSGSYTDLTNQPTIPTSFSSLVNGAKTVSLSSSGNLTLPSGLTFRKNGTPYSTITADLDKVLQIETQTSGGVKQWSLGTDGSLTFPNGALKIAGNTISNYVIGDPQSSGSQLEVSQSKTVITNGVTNSLGGGPSSLIGQSLFEVGPNGILSSFQVINTLDDTSLTGEYLTELDNLNFKIGQRVTNDLGDGSEPLVAFSGWTFSTDAPGYTKTLTLPVNSSILTNETALNIATHSTTTYTFNQAYWEAVDGDITRVVTPTGNAQYFACTVTRNQDSTYTAAVTNAGISFVPGNWFKVPGDELGGATPANDIQITVATVNGSGTILTTTVTGTAVGKQWQFGTTGGLTFPDDTVQSTAWTGSVAYSSVTGTPTLATVATSGSYTDLSNKPTIPSITGLATESYVTNAIGNLVSTAPTALNTLSELATALGNDSNFSGTVTTSLGNRLRVDINTQNLTTLQKSNAVTNLGLATVAASGSYTDLSNKPTLFSGSYTDLSNKPTLFSGSYTDLSNKPTIPTNLDSITDVALSSPTTGQVLKYNGTNWVNDVDASGAGGALPSRTTTSAVTTTIANGASENITVTGFKGYIIYKLQTSAAAWVRAYTSIAERTADESRTITTDPTPGSGVVAEIITTGAQTVNMAPATIGFSNESAPDVNIPIRVTNRSGSSAAITVTMTLIQIEV